MLPAEAAAMRWVRAELGGPDDYIGLQRRRHGVACTPDDIGLQPGSHGAAASVAHGRVAVWIAHATHGCRCVLGGAGLAGGVVKRGGEARQLALTLALAP